MKYFINRRTVGLLLAVSILILTVLGPVIGGNYISQVQARTSFQSELQFQQPVNTPTIEPTILALEKEKLLQEVEQLKKSNRPGVFQWLVQLGTPSAALAVGLFGLLQWFSNRRDERLKRAEERFQKAVEGLGHGSEATKVGSAVTLRTFLGPGYEEFYAQVFSLAVANLRIEGRTADRRPDVSPTPLQQTLVTIIKEAFPPARHEQERKYRLRKAALAAVRTAVSLVQRMTQTNQGQSSPAFRRWIDDRSRRWYRPDLLDATGVNLFFTYLAHVDLRRIWMPDADLRHAVLRDSKLMRGRFVRTLFDKAVLVNTNFSGADLRSAGLRKVNAVNANFTGARLEVATLSESNLCGANFTAAHLDEAELSNSNLKGANFRRADLRKAKITGAKTELYGAILSRADLRGADLTDAKIEQVSKMDGAQMQAVQGLSTEQIRICKLRGAIFDVD